MLAAVAPWVLAAFSITSPLGDTAAYVLHPDVRPAFESQAACEGAEGSLWMRQWLEIETSLEIEDDDVVRVACQLESGVRA